MELHADGQTFGPVLVATTFWQRLRGVLGRESAQVVLIPGRSVHSAFLRRPLRVVGIDAEGEVVGSALLRPWRTVGFRRAKAVLELPAEVPAPPVGARLSPWPPA